MFLLFKVNFERLEETIQGPTYIVPVGIFPRHCLLLFFLVDL